MNTLPIISLAELKSTQSDNIGNEEHSRLYDACYQYGFFYLKDHGIAPELIQQTIEASRNFFQLPEEIKTQYGQDQQVVNPKTSRGYIPLYGETLQGAFGPDPKEIFDFGLDRPLADLPFTGPTIVPDDTVAPGFVSSHYQLQSEVMTKIIPHLLRALALTLGLEASFFDPYFDEPILIHRTIYYPSRFGVAGKHTDNGIFTILIQECFPEPSLRVYTQDQWIDVVCLENAFVINLGDMLQLWTNGLFASTPHEVMHKLVCSRISIPFFVYPKVNTIIEPKCTNQKINATEVMLKNFNAIWVEKTGGGRAKELK